MSPDARTLLLTGRPGVGKTTALRRAADRLSDLVIRGFYTEEVRGPSGGRTGFRALPFRPGRGAGDEGGERDGADRHGGPDTGDGGDDAGRLIASVDFDGPPRVSRYGVDVGAVDEVTRRYLAAEGGDAAFVDEIGKMECHSERFVARMEELVGGDLPVVATVARRGGGLIRRVKEVPGTELREVTTENRDALPERIEGWVRERVGGRRP